MAVDQMKPPAPGDSPPSPEGGDAMDPNEMLDAAEKDGTLQPLTDLMTEKGWPLDAKTFMVLAQKDPRTEAKKVAEVVTMLQDAQGEQLYQDIAGLAPGGAVDRAYSSVERRLGVRPGAKKAHPDEESPAEDATEKPGSETAEDASGKPASEKPMNMFEKMRAMKAKK